MVDNGSTDGSVDRWDERHPDVTLIQTGANLGYAGGVNRGLADLDDVDAVALVNSDAFVEPGWLRPLAAALDADAGARRRRRPKILFADAEPTGRRRINNVGQRARADAGSRTTAATARSTPASTTARRTCGAGAAPRCCSAAATSTTSVASTSGSSCTPRTPT